MILITKTSLLREKLQRAILGVCVCGGNLNFMDSIYSQKYINFDAMKCTKDTKDIS